MQTIRKLRRLLATISPGTFAKNLEDLPDCPGRTGEFYGMNWQFVRASIIIKLANELGFDSFIETGTNQGETCLLMAAQTKLPIFSCDINADNLKKARLRVLPYLGRRVSLSHQDAATFLQTVLFSSGVKRPLIYLDAHIDSQLPLRRELQTVFSRLENFFILIDDFKVPSDTGFNYMTYGEHAVDWEHIESTLATCPRPMFAFYPAYASGQETGMRMGFILLATKDYSDRIKEIVPSHLLACHAVSSLIKGADSR